jgi:plasmid maintenance system antidote protein VapI
MQAVKVYNPPHPGELLRGPHLEPLDQTVKAAAEGLGVNQSAV